MKKQSRVVRILIDVDTWRSFRIEGVKIRRSAAWILGELARRWVANQKQKELTNKKRGE